MRLLLPAALLGGANLACAQLAGSFTESRSSPNAEDEIFPPLGETYPAAGPKDKSEYDYIIVGSGAGGAPLAARLALANFSVLLIEAGEDHAKDRQTSVPAFHPKSSEFKQISWNFFVDHYENETQARRDSKMNYLTPDGDYYTGLWPEDGYEQLGIMYPRVGALGGCTQHNALAMVYPQASDFDNIAALTGDDTWKDDNMRSYFRKLEHCHYIQGVLPSLAGSHGVDGWLHTILTPTILIVEDLKVASVLLGYCTALGKGLLGGLLSTVGGLVELLALDVNHKGPDRDTVEEIYQIPMSAKPDYTRSSPRDFVYEVATAENDDGTKKYKLEIALNTLVTKINFDTTGTTPKAEGVNYLYGKSLYRADPRAESTDSGEPGTVYASKEVIVSGGTFNTPQLLKLSGVGPAAELEKFDIPVVLDLPGVGGNMQDRYEISMVGAAPTEFSLLAKCTFLNGTDPCYDNWANPNLLEGAKGGYTTGGIAAGALAFSSVAEDNVGPDLFKGGTPTYFAGYYPGYASHAVSRLDTWSWYTLKSHSRNNAGTVNITSANPRDVPKISFHSFLEGNGGEEDLQAIYEGVQYSLKAMKSIIPLDGSFDRIWPPTNVSSEADLKQFIQDEAWGHHASGTCPIGTDDDPMAVLDGDFKVRGISGLRVVDASIFPKIPGEFICLAIFMASEKAADVIIAAAQ